jgi:alpha-ketoglutarate-dependent taurine dioxygenase
MLQSPSKSTKRNDIISSIHLDETEHKSACIINWEDGSTSSVPLTLLQQQWRTFQQDHKSALSITNPSYSLTPPWVRKSVPRRTPWTHWNEQTIRDPSSPIQISFQDIIQSGSNDHHRAIQTLYTYGLLFITDTPLTLNQCDTTTVPAIAALASALSGGTVKTTNSSLLPRYHQRSAISCPTTSHILDNTTDGPLRTLYGVVWTTEASSTHGTSTADSSYGHDALPLHTDMTYIGSPPGLQIFTMIQPASVGGESVFCDGLAVAETLRQEQETAFDILCRTQRTYRCIDDELGWHLEASGPVIYAEDKWESYPLGSSLEKREDSDRWGEILGIRHNDLDRLPDRLPRFMMNRPMSHPSINDFYHQLELAHHALDDILNRDEFRLVVKLKPGETMVVLNQRCLHGRFSFQVDKQHPRKVMGCYVSQDDLLSMFRSTLGVEGIV